MHIKRLKEHLESDGLHVTVYNTSSELQGGHDPAVIQTGPLNRRSIMRYFGAVNGDIIHFHDSSSWAGRVAFTVLFRVLKRSATIVTLHNPDITSLQIVGAGPEENPSLFRRIVGPLLVRMLGLNSALIAVSSDIQRSLLGYGVRSTKVNMIPAHLRPTVTDDDVARVPAEVWDFIAEHSPVVVLTCSFLGLRNGADIYGLDRAVEACSLMRARFPDIGFLTLVTKVADEDYFRRTQEAIVARNVTRHFGLFRSGFELCPVLLRSDLHLRPTLVDGDAVSIREALHFGVPVLASDICARPSGCAVYQADDIRSLVEAAAAILNGASGRHDHVPAHGEVDFYEQVKSVYAALVPSVADSSPHGFPRVSSLGRTAQERPIEG